MSRKTRGACWQKDPSQCRLHGYASVAHTQQAHKNLRQAEDNYLDSVQANNPSQELYAEYQTAKLEYFATPDGQRILKEEISKLQGSSHSTRLLDLISLQERTNLWIDNFEAMNKELQKPTEASLPFDTQTGQRKLLPLPPAYNDTGIGKIRVLSNFEHDGIEATILWDKKTGRSTYSYKDAEGEEGLFLGVFHDEQSAVKNAERYYNKNLVPILFPIKVNKSV